ncbi:hypothetical protein BDV12DRAFT_76746 [Aspergillus spectabilis]
MLPLSDSSGAWFMQLRKLRHSQKNSLSSTHRNTLLWWSVVTVLIGRAGKSQSRALKLETDPSAGYEPCLCIGTRAYFDIIHHRSNFHAFNLSDFILWA